MMNFLKFLMVAVLALTLATACKSQKEATSSSTPPQEEARQGRGGEGQRKGPPSVDEVFKMDSNQDGKLSPSEVKGPLAKNFPKIDTDGDGFISKEELKNAPRPERGQRPPRTN